MEQLPTTDNILSGTVLENETHAAVFFRLREFFLETKHGLANKTRLGKNLKKCSLEKPTK
ncbi:MAG: hypothetical protein ACI4QL_05325 [Candidatus Fimimonas sp.]